MGREFLWSIKQPLKPSNSLLPVSDDPEGIVDYTWENPITASNSTPVVQPPNGGLQPDDPDTPKFDPEIPPYIDPEVPPWMVLGPPWSIPLLNVGRHGSIIFRGAKTWTTLGPDTATYALTTNGVGADPTWEER